MDRIPILYVKGEEAVAEDLRLVVSLDPQSLSRMERSKTLLQFAQNIFVHPVTLSWRRPQSSLMKPDAGRHLQHLVSLVARRAAIIRTDAAFRLSVRTAAA